MIAVKTLLPVGRPRRPPVVLVHGAANSAVVWRYWQGMLADAGWASHAIDLRGHGSSTPQSLSSVSMNDYLDDVSTLVAELAQRPVLIGWSMGGLVAMMAAAQGLARACVGLEPSQPASRSDPGVPLRDGEFGPEEYGVTDAASVARIAPGLDSDERVCVVESLCRESRRARDERKAGIVIKRLPCPALVIADPARPDYRDRHKSLRDEDSRLGIEFLDVSTTSHWDLVLNRRFLANAMPRVATWLEERL